MRLFIVPGTVVGAGWLVLFALCISVPVRAGAQEKPYFVTYSHDLEEPGNLEIETKAVAASPKNGSAFFAPTLELEYGATGWWTTEVYLTGQSTASDSTVYTGFRWENRFRPLPHEYWINPVLYVEYEDINGADKSFLEVVGHDTIGFLDERNASLRSEHEREVETKLILSGNARGVNLAVNVIEEKRVNAPDAWEFGYALAASRPLALTARSYACTLCRQNLSVGAEMFGGLGERYSFGLKDTSHYAGPVLALVTPRGFTYRLSPAFGLNDNAARVLFRFGVAYEIPQVGGLFRRAQ